VNNDGTFNYSWPIQSIKGRTFWIGLFEKSGTIQQRGSYMKSPNEYSKASSNYVHFK